MLARIIRLVTAGAATVLLLVTLLSVLAAAVIAGQLREASLAAAQWDIPPQLVPVFEEAAQAAGIPWFLLAALASVSTDFARHPPDGVARGETIGTSLFPVVTPPILAAGGGAGMFLVDPAPAGSGLADPQDVRASAEYLSGALVRASGGPPLPEVAGQALTRPDAARFWTDAVGRLPVRITVVAPGQSVGSGSGTSGDGGGSDNPVRQFGRAVLARIGAPATVGDLDAIDAWAAGEGSCARYNPLDSTQPEAGATPFNTIPGGSHVWNYPSWEVGIRASVETLLNGLYGPIIAALQADAGVAAIEAAVARSPWGTKTFGSISYSGARCGAANEGPPPPVNLPTVDGPQSIPATVVARAARYQAIWDEGSGNASPGP